MIFANQAWIDHTNELYWGISQFWFMNLVNVLAWVAQFIGHGFFEQRAPAISTNLAFALLAPFFITFEIMSRLFGFKEGKQMQILRKLIEQDISEFHAKK